METEERKDKVGWIIPVIMVTFVVSACYATWHNLADYERRGTFGDMFGITNAFFSGLAFAGVIYAILLQRKELKFQREELELTRGELKGRKLGSATVILPLVSCFQLFTSASFLGQILIFSCIPGFLIIFS